MKLLLIKIFGEEYRNNVWEIQEEYENQKYAEINNFFDLLAKKYENVEVNLEEIYNARDKSKLYLLDKNELRILRNYPFAKEGYRFKDTELKEYFESQSWYEPSNYLSNEEISILKKDDDWFMYIKKYMEFSSYD